MDFLEILGENWFEILSAVGTIAAIFLTRNGKKTAAEKQAAKIARQEKKVDKEIAKAKADALKLENMKLQGGTNS